MSETKDSGVLNALRVFFKLMSSSRTKLAPRNKKVVFKTSISDQQQVNLIP